MPEETRTITVDASPNSKIMDALLSSSAASFYTSGRRTRTKQKDKLNNRHGEVAPTKNKWQTMHLTT